MNDQIAKCKNIREMKGWLTQLREERRETPFLSHKVEIEHEIKALQHRIEELQHEMEDRQKQLWEQSGGGSGLSPKENHDAGGD